MKRSSDIILITAFLLFPLFLFPQTAGTGRKEKILKERIEKEKNEVSYALKVSQQELEVINTMALNTVLKYRKLDFLSRSSEIMKKKCLFFDLQCKKIYNMSIAYLKNEMKLTKKDLDEYELLRKESHARLNDLNEKMVLLEKGVEVETGSVKIKPAIPELKNSYKCINEASWNSFRGIFVNSAEIKDLPFSVFIKDVVSLACGGKVIMVEMGDLTVHFSYVKTPAVKKGEIVNIGKKLFTGSTGNPVKPGYILIFITKDGKFVHPGFMCR